MTKRRFPAPQIALARARPARTPAQETAGMAARPVSVGARRTARLTPSDIERLKQLEDDYSKLKQIVAGLDLD